ncbi:Uncharacterised protein [Bordetella pertussis]|nr:Uncharacterised protein [Bordetella pertussis]
MQVHVQAVGRYVEFAIAKPPIERRLGLVQDLREGLGPLQVLARQARPEPVEVLVRFLAQGPIGVHARNRGALHGARRRREYAILDQDGLNGIRHGVSPMNDSGAAVFLADTQPYRHALTGTLR